MRKKLTAIVLAVLAFSMIAASAASLNGITTSDLGAETDVVAGCDPDGILVDFTVAYNGTTGEYDTDDVVIDDIHANCDGQDLTVTLKGAGGPWSATTTLALGGGTSYSASISAPAEEVTGIAVVIDG